jgi:hypothetical protein
VRCVRSDQLQLAVVLPSRFGVVVQLTLGGSPGGGGAVCTELQAVALYASIITRIFSSLLLLLLVGKGLL